MPGPLAEPTTSLRRRRNESFSKSTTHVSGWDHPPAIASPLSLDCRNEDYGSWIPRECHWKTPQRLATLDPSQSDKQKEPKDFCWGNLFCSPILVANKYILVASDTILSIYGNFDSDFPKESRQQQRIDTKAIPPLAKFSLTSEETNGTFQFGDKILQINYHEETSIVYALTVESCIYQVKLIFDDSSQDGTQQDSGAQPPPRFEMMHNWITRQLGATCMATWSQEGESDMVCVGYKSGHIEAWKVRRVHSRDPKPQRMGIRQPRTKGAVLEWDGFLYDAVRTLAYIPRSNGASTLDPVDEFNNYYLMAIVSIGTRTGDKGNEQETSSMLKILDLKQIANEKKNKDSRSSNTSNDEDKDLSLESFLLPQPRGMELIDASTISLSKESNLPKRIPILDGHGANAAHKLSNGDKSSPLTGLCFPDGVVGMFSCKSLDSSSDMVGIVEANHQLLLSYPAIGIGQVNGVDENGKPVSYLGTCLRGGTCYLIPITTKNSTSIGVIPFPHDMESDLTDIYVEAFTAGNLVVDGVDQPVLVYAWPSGVIDVYSCELLNDCETPKNEDVTDDIFVSRAERRCLRDMMDNDSISLVAKILEESRDTSLNPLLQTEEWDQLFREIKAGKTLPTREEDITLESLCSKEFQSLRRVLLSLAAIND